MGTVSRSRGAAIAPTPCSHAPPCSRFAGRDLPIDQLANVLATYGSRRDIVGQALPARVEVSDASLAPPWPLVQTRQEAKTAIFTWIECWCNPLRRQSRFGYRSLGQHERAHDL